MNSEKEEKNKPKYNMWQNSAYMVKLAWKLKEKKVIFLSILSAVFAIILNLLNLYISPVILSAVENKTDIFQLIFLIATFVVSMMLCQAVSSYIGTNLPYGKVTLRCIGFCVEINEKAATTSYQNFISEKFTNMLVKSGDATAGNRVATEAVWNTLTLLFQNFVGFTIYVVLLSSVNPVIILIIIITSVISFFINKHVYGYEYRHRDEVAGYNKRMWYVGDISKDYKAAKDIRIFGLRPWFEELNDNAVKIYKSFYKKAEGIYLIADIAGITLTLLRNGVAYVYLIYLVLSESISAPEFLLYFTAVEGFASWVSGILNNLLELHRQSLDISIVREFLEYPECFKFEEGEVLNPETDGTYEIRLENVSFKYSGAEKNTLTNIDLTLQPGEKLAVVGLNGAGKTTLVKLICGYLDPTEGRVLLNGKDIRDYNRRDYYRMFSAVFQEFSILAGSIALNVAQTEADIDMEKVKECIEQAGLKEKIESLPEKYDAKLDRSVYDEAIMLSGGETQRLILARALYKNAPVILLDEPTSALDPIAEADMYNKYNEMAKGRSSVYISHRLASTRFCNRIILIDDGEIVEEGSHEELLEAEGKYASLFKTQSKYYSEEKGGENDE